MSKVQEYLRQKRIKELGLPKMYIVKSTPEGVDLPIEVQTVIKNLQDEVEDGIYKIEEQYPYEIKIKKGEISELHEGHGSGFGDLWGWSYYCTLSKEDADTYYERELKRVTDKYLNNPDRDKVDYIMPVG